MHSPTVTVALLHPLGGLIGHCVAMFGWSSPADGVVSASSSPPPVGVQNWLNTRAGVTLAVFTTFFSFITAASLTVWFPNKVKGLEIRLNAVEAQLKELYGPLLAECLRTDSIFRRVEQTLDCMGHVIPYGEQIRQVVASDFSKLKKPFDQTGSQLDVKRRYFARVLSTIYLASNEAKTKLLKANVHLYGPYPPLSFFLFLTHAAQFEALMMIKKDVDIAVPPGNEHTYKDPYFVAPFPALLTAEVVAKVAFLKSLQREYRYRLGSASRVLFAGEVFRRKQYYLLLSEQTRDQLNGAMKGAVHYAPVSPLLWGPYTAVELLEIRSWLIGKTVALAEMTVLRDEHALFTEVMKAEVATVTRERRGRSFTSPLHHRVGQAFDELDEPGSKRIRFWTAGFRWTDLSSRQNQLQLESRFERCGYTLADLPSEPGFAYDPRKAKRLREGSQRVMLETDEEPF